MCVEDWQEGRELWLIIDRCAGGGSFERQSKGLQLNRVCIWAVLNRPCQKKCRVMYEVEYKLLTYVDLYDVDLYDLYRTQAARPTLPLLHPYPTPTMCLNLSSAKGWN